MFYWFLKDYEINIFKANDRKIKSLYIWEKVLLLLLVLMSIVFFIINLFMPSSIINYIILGSLIAIIIIIYFLENNREKKELEKIVENFKKNKIQPLISMLQDQNTLLNRSLDSKEGIEWLLKSCSTEIEKYNNKSFIFSPIKNFFFTLLLPMATYIGGTITSTFSNSERLNFSIMIIVILLMLFGIYCMASPILNDLLKKQIRVLEDLKSNLEYYKMIKND